MCMHKEGLPGSSVANLADVRLVRGPHVSMQAFSGAGALLPAKAPVPPARPSHPRALGKPSAARTERPGRESGTGLAASGLNVNSWHRCSETPFHWKARERRAPKC
uniref:Uncharacterized protein n=1 Tax=Alexandrium monilatum TaxID=311494 RepID=A0A7S4SWD7_9DINO